MYHAWKHHLNIFQKLGLKTKLKGKCFPDNLHENTVKKKKKALGSGQNVHFPTKSRTSMTNF